MTNRRGNQTGHELDLPSGETLGDLFNPGHAPGTGAPRTGLVDIDAEGDISDGAKVTLGRYLSDSTKGKVGVGRPNVFQVPSSDSRLSQTVGSVDSNASSFNGPLAAAELRTFGKTEGTFLDVVAGEDPIAAIKFKMTSTGQYGNDLAISPFQFVKSASSAAQILAPSLSKIPGVPSGLFDAVGNALSISGHNLLLKIGQKGDAGSAELGNPSIGRTSSLLSQLTSPNLVQPAISSILSNNRFNQIDRAFVQNHERTGTGAVIQPRLGSNVERGGYELSEKDLMSISGHITSQAAGVDGKGSSPDRRATGLPTISSRDLRASQAVATKTKYSNTDLINEEDVFSYGTLYTTDETFSNEASLEVAYEISATSINTCIDRAVRARDAGYKIEGNDKWFMFFLMGLEAFYGTKISDEKVRLDTQNLPGDFKARISSSPGYYAAVARGALREAEGDDSSVDSWRFTVSMVVLGDRAQQSRLVSIRSRASDQPLEWSHLASPRSSYVLPPSLLQANNMRFNSDAASTAILTVPGDEFSGRRLNPEYVRKIEGRLEVEYVPFYFHDVRTNEVIGFHAFLSSLTDGFAANYNSTTGYGRAEDVMVYNNTKRSIGFDFHLVATSKDDHDALYWNVNKLVSMLYPQYSRGRTVISGDQRFIQPFSQIPTASPLVRIRIGDVVKSNYSRFGLARLFGLGQDTQAFSVSSSADIERYNEQERAALEAFEYEKNILREKGPLVGDEVSVTGQWLLSTLQTREGAGLDDDEAGFAAIRNFVERVFSTTELLSSDALLVASVKDAKVIEAAAFQDDPNLVDVLLELRVLHIKTTARRIVLNETSSPKLADALGEYRYLRLYVPIGPNVRSTLTFTPSYAEQILNQKRSEQGVEDPPSNTDEAIREFFSPGEGTTGNPIVRSFESSRGRGMAGFITGMTMDWADSTWEIDEGSKAPISLKISVTFSPIHDIPLGLDSDGAMRAVAYGVGRHSNALGGDPYDSE